MKQNPTVIIRDQATRLHVLDLIAALSPDKPWAITVEPYKKRRSLSQNALMWAWINDVAKHVHEATGQDNDEIHEFFKGQFLPRRIIEIGGIVENAPGSTKDLTTAEMATYMGQIYAWVTSELGLLLPVPEDMWAA